MSQSETRLPFLAWATGEVRRSETSEAPVPWPTKVIRLGSPPKFATFSWSNKSWSQFIETSRQQQNKKKLKSNLNISSSGEVISKKSYTCNQWSAAIWSKSPKLVTTSPCKLGRRKPEIINYETSQFFSVTAALPPNCPFLFKIVFVLIFSTLYTFLVTM